MRDRLRLEAACARLSAFSMDGAWEFVERVKPYLDLKRPLRSRRLVQLEQCARRLKQYEYRHDFDDLRFRRLEQFLPAALRILDVSPLLLRKRQKDRIERSVWFVLYTLLRAEKPRDANTKLWIRTLDSLYD